jgi:hypothetical protein
MSSLGNGGSLKMRRTLVALLVLCFVHSVFGQTGGPIQTATVTLSAVQLQHLKTSPVQLVAAPGAHNVINLISEVAQYKFATAAYMIGEGGDLDLQLGTNTIREPVRANGFLDQASNQIQTNGGYAGGDQSGLENQPLMLANNGAGEWTGGDGTVTITVYYAVVTLQ